jgi:hypothetical protein
MLKLVVILDRVSDEERGEHLRQQHVFNLPAGTDSQEARMRIAVIGTGHIGGTLGTRWQAAGHEVVFGARTARPDGPGGAEVMIVDDALIEGDVVVLAVPGGAVADAVDAQRLRLDGKVVIDATNNLAAPEHNGYAAIRAAAPDARYARAFNTLGWENFADPPQGADLFFAADPMPGGRPSSSLAISGSLPLTWATRARAASWTR